MGIEAINVVIKEILTSKNPNVVSTTLHGLNIDNPLNKRKDVNRDVDSDEEEEVDEIEKKCPECGKGLGLPNDQMVKYIAQIIKDITDSKEMKKFPEQEYFNHLSKLEDYTRQFVLVWRPHLILFGGLNSFRCANERCKGTCIQIYICIYIHILRICILFIYLFIHTWIYVCLYILMNAYSYLCTCIYTYTDTYTYINV
jgi:hypothetical protein